ncbi:diguanylate cyclase/phosphodiesterase [Cellulomonas flavigena DSM 20109]|uniref:Diguanylate cyclase/phosphodiesterase n=1 Tax=Cellulomonas flavigena (strain ATCC 482 / DSM 20109 / BCRC 11376 / JCM 18109 / NBRC 3775 / NCIMB 8073 / NRS 134) TaxID=446466 RepID=D5UJS2_CELFN|nr:EAL domain-containing protein [Cellulomonas flavigena]ADG75710.1 diguanylate cyclase/phosphodiesterase [Cellulomonas flavigena DSM 20109]
MVLVGVALVLVTSAQMRGQAVRDGTAAASRMAAFAARAVPTASFVTGVLSADERDAAAAAVAGFGDELVELRLWSTDGRLMYSSDGATTGLPAADRLGRVMASGQPDAVVQPDVRAGGAAADERTVIDVYVPVRVSDTADPGDLADGAPDEAAGAVEVMLDHTGTQQTLRTTTRTVTLVVVGSLVVLWLLLFQIVHSTSRRLRSTALENARLALLDSLTGLPNRRLLSDQMQRAIDRAADDPEARVGLILLDIDRFKDINDTLGHDHGDELLQQVAERLRHALRDDDVVARLGGDEFAILLPDVRTVANAERLAMRVRGLFTRPFELSDIALHVETSIGVACLPDHAADASALMRTADIAMYAAKHHRTGVSVYSPTADDSSPARLVLLGELHQALESRGDPGAEPQLELHYQPKIELATQRTVGLEALIRWRHPARGLLPPGAFVPLAEQSGLIHRVTHFALEESVRQLAAWRAQGEAVPVAVNLSAHDVASPAVVDMIELLLAEHEVEASLLEVEITETALVADRTRVVPVLERLSALGVRVAIDDFGTGTTSISQMRDLPVAELKIDRLFVADLGEGGRAGSEVVVQAMVDLAHSFGLRVVAEGVEDEATARTLEELGVDRAQGYLWARPAPASALHPPGGHSLHPIG